MIHKLQWKDWACADGTSMTWVHDINGNLDILASWNKGIKNQHLENSVFLILA
jgi:hypothetical protein